MRSICIIILILVLNSGRVESCSPYAVPPLSSQQVSGSNLIINWQSATAWACNYNIYTEIRCQSNPGGAPEVTNLSGCISKSSTATIAYPSAQTIDLSSLCPGETYIFRAKETPCGNSGGGSSWTADFTFVAGGTSAFALVVSPSVTGCIGTCVTMVGLAQNSCNPSVSYSWDNGGGTDSIATVCPTSTTTYTVTASSTTNCGAISSSDTVTVTIELPPVGGVSVASPDHICEGDSTMLSLSGYNGVIQWQYGSTQTGPWINLGVGDTSSFITPALFTDTYYRAELSNVCGTDFSNITLVYAEPFPVMVFSFNDICIYETAVFNNNTSITSGAVASWAWDFGDGVTSTVEDPSHKYLSPNTYAVGLIAISDYGCIDSITKDIVIHPEPIADYTTMDVCRYTTAQFTENSSVSTGLLDSWFWTFGDGNTSSAQNPSHIYNSFGTYNVQMVVYTDNGCRDTSIQVIEIFAVPVADYTATTECLNTPPTQFTNGSAIPDGTQLGYIWSFADGDSSNLSDPDHIYLTDGIYDVVLITTSTNLCYDTITDQVEVYSIPVVGFQADTLVGCAPLTIEFTNSSSNAVTYEWDLGDGSLSNEVEPQHTYQDPGIITDYTITLTATTSNNCVEVLTKVDYITIWPLPNADFWAGPNPATILYPYMEFKNLSSGDLTVPTTYYWDFGDSSSYVGLDTLHVYNDQDTGTYIVRLITENGYGCLDTAYETIIIKYDYILYAPSAFTPNGDGYNETFFPVGIGFNDPSFQFKLSIINRWGDVIFQTSDFREGWNGTANGSGEPAQQDVYVWMIETQDVTISTRKHKYVGHVTLFR